MVHVDTVVGMHPATALPDQLADVVRAAWGIDGGPTVSLSGGQEAAVFRCGHHVIKVGAVFRRDDDLTWCGAVAAFVAQHVPEVLAPVPSVDGRTVVRVGDHPVTVWPYAEGRPGNDTDAAQRRAAAELLARVHVALAAAELPPPPPRANPAAATPDLDDPDLDDWLAAFGARATAQLVHGDFYADNVLVDPHGRVAALLDWDETTQASAEWELAGAAWEWGGCRATLDLSTAEHFIELYLAAGGTANRLDDVALRQLIRHRIRGEVAYDRATAAACTPDPEDAEYQARQLQAFHELRPASR